MNGCEICERKPYLSTWWRERERQRLEERKKTAEARNDLIDNGQRVKKPTG